MDIGLNCQSCSLILEQSLTCEKVLSYFVNEQESILGHEFDFDKTQHPYSQLINKYRVCTQNIFQHTSVCWAGVWSVIGHLGCLNGPGSDGVVKLHRLAFHPSCLSITLDLQGVWGTSNVKHQFAGVWLLRGERGDGRSHQSLACRDVLQSSPAATDACRVISTITLIDSDSVWTIVKLFI